MSFTLTHQTRRRAAGVLVPLAAALAAAAMPASASAGPVFPTASDDPSGLVMHATPSRDGARVGRIPAGGKVEVLCQTTGSQESDPKYGTSSIWDQVKFTGDGTVGFVTDLYVLSNQDHIAGVGACGGAAPAPGPGPAPGPTPAPGGSAVDGPISRSEVMARSLPWIQRRVMYSQSRYTDGYRQDCSGYMSLVWHLKGSPNSPTLRSSKYTRIISKGELQPGDMLGHPGHVALFVRWAAPGRAVVREEYDDGHPASERTWSVKNTSQNTAYRYKNVR
ncbi:MAG: hypothetical protein QOK16_1587 [Solirubrobacteraceae bacterium]|jgi:hypothetical protein|nr:hypothetical protein [Solirubrobacteraceae bacterium]